MPVVSAWSCAWSCAWRVHVPRRCAPGSAARKGPRARRPPPRPPPRRRRAAARRATRPTPLRPSCASSPTTPSCCATTPPRSPTTGWRGPSSRATRRGNTTRARYSPLARGRRRSPLAPHAHVPVLVHVHVPVRCRHAGDGRALPLLGRRLAARSRGHPGEGDVALPARRQPAPRQQGRAPAARSAQAAAHQGLQGGRAARGAARRGDGAGGAVDPRDPPGGGAAPRAGRAVLPLDATRAAAQVRLPPHPRRLPLHPVRAAPPRGARPTRDGVHCTCTHALHARHCTCARTAHDVRTAHDAHCARTHGRCAPTRRRSPSTRARAGRMWRTTCTSRSGATARRSARSSSRCSSSCGCSGARANLQTGSRPS